MGFGFRGNLKPLYVFSFFFFFFFFFILFFFFFFFIFFFGEFLCRYMY